MDVTPPTDSDEVKAWVAAIDWTKVSSAPALFTRRGDAPGHSSDVLPFVTC